MLACTTTKTTVSPPDQLIDEAYISLNRGRFSDAEQKFLELLTKYLRTPKVVLGLVKVYEETDRKEQAVTLLQKSIQEKEVPIYYSVMGSLLLDQGDLTSALEAYVSYQKRIDQDSDNQQLVREKIDRIKYALFLLDNPSEINISPLPSSINTDEAEYQPRFTFDQSVIIFTRKINGQEDLYTAVYSDTTWQVQAIDAVNTPYNEGSQTISGDGRYMIFTHCNENYGFGSCDLYESVLADRKWQRPRNLGPRINTKGWESQPSLSADGQRLYFASNRPGGIGQSDIWLSKRDSLGWAPPENLGSVINTPDKEESPFIHADGRSLYFRSTGHPGIGSYDIFLSRYKNSTWQQPLNLGAPINSVGADGDLVVSLDGTKGYFATDAQTSSFDIYSFDMPDIALPEPMTYVKGKVRSSSSGEPLAAALEVNNLNTGETILNQSVNADGTFLVAVPVGQPLAMYLTAPGYIFFSEHIYYESSRQGLNPYSEDIYLIPNRPFPDDKSEGNEPIRLSNVFFQSGSDVLIESSQAELERLYQLMETQAIRIKIMGHTDDVGSEEDNKNLSESRAIAIKRYLANRGIDTDRIFTEGMGESKPIADNTTEEGRAKNRRTEFVIIY